MVSIFEIYGPEGLYIEYKEEVPNPQTLSKTMVSFSNTKGGRIIIGVEDKSYKIVGIKSNFDIEEYVMNVASNNCDPIITPAVELHTYGEKLIVIVDVPAGSIKPYHLKGKSVDGSTYIRVGSTCRLADKANIARLMREAVNESFDRLSISKTSDDDLDFGKIERHQILKFDRMGTPKEKISDSYLKKIGIKKNAEKRSLITCGGMLLFGKAPQNISILSKANFKIARFKGKEMGNIIDHDVIEGTLDDQIEKTAQFVQKHMLFSGAIRGLKREDKFTYPMPAIREIITNAVVHRDYSRAANESIMCRIFDDRIEVESPGLLPMGVRVENLGEVQNTRNPLIARFLFDMNYFDEWGQGIKRIIESCKSNGNPQPVFQEKDTTFMVTVFSKSGSIKFSFKERSALLIDYIKSSKEIASQRYQELTGIGRAQAAKDFEQLIKSGMIRRTGKGRNIKYTF